MQAQERALEQAENDVTVLTAERAHLARPERLEPLARLLGLAPISSGAISAHRRRAFPPPVPRRRRGRAQTATRRIPPTPNPSPHEGRCATDPPLRRGEGDGHGRDQEPVGQEASAAVARGCAAATPDAWRRICCVLLAFAPIAGQLVRLALKAGPEIKVTLAEPLAQQLVAARHRRPQRPPARHRRRGAFALRRPAADPRPRRGDREALSPCSPASTRRSCARRWPTGAGASPGWRAGSSPRAGAARARSGSAGSRLPHRAQARLSAGRACRPPASAPSTPTTRASPASSACSTRPAAWRPCRGPGRTPDAPVRLSLDIGVQHALAEELKQACARYSASAAAGLVLDANSGEILARRLAARRSTRRGRPTGSTRRCADRLFGRHLRARLDLQDAHHRHGAGGRHGRPRQDLRRAPAAHRRALHHQGPASAGPAAERARDLPAFLQRRRRHAGAGGAARERQRAFLDALGPHEPMRTEAGPVAPPQLPKHWGTHRDHHHRLRARAGGGAAAVRRSRGGPRQRRRQGDAHAAGAVRRRQASGRAWCRPATSAKLREIMRLNVTHAAGTGRRAEAEGYRVGGKTGTAEMPGRGGYQEKSRDLLLRRRVSRWMRRNT